MTSSRIQIADNMDFLCFTARRGLHRSFDIVVAHVHLIAHEAYFNQSSMVVLAQGATNGLTDKQSMNSKI